MPVDRKSRYVKSPRVSWRRRDGSLVELIGQTHRPDRESVFSTIATDSDRLDSLAARYYRDPAKLWKIADASDQIDPFDAVEPGAPIAIPPDK
jgi:nucleoid-associated protein YgaU